MTSDEVLEWPVEKSGYEIRVTGGDEEIVLVRTDIGGEQTVRWGHGAFLDAPNGIGWSNYDEVLKKGKAVWVAPAENLEGSRWCETYEPMKEQGLYEQFANLKRSQKAVIEFANRYGLLGRYQMEPLPFWYQQSEALRTAVLAYDLVQDDEDHTPRIRSVFNLPKEMNRQETSRHVMKWVIGVINRHLDGKASLRLITRTKPAEEQEGFGFPDALTFVPCSLLAALWLQFALQIYGVEECRICQNCGKPFWLKTPETDDRSRRQRADMKYCNGACRITAFRKRKRSQ